MFIRLYERTASEEEAQEDVSQASFACLERRPKVTPGSSREATAHYVVAELGFGAGTAISPVSRQLIANQLGIKHKQH